MRSRAHARRPHRPLTALVLAVGLASGAAGTTLLQTDLTDLCRTAHRIFSGRVVAAEPGTVVAGGGELPTITYTIEVDEALKGEFEQVKGRRVARLTMLGKLPVDPAADRRRAAVLPGLPRLHLGERLLLFTTRPGVTGLSATVGLQQGCFRIAGEAGRETAVNGFDNRGLLRRRPSGVSESARAGGAGSDEPEAGPLPLAELLALTRARLARDAEQP